MEIRNDLGVFMLNVTLEKQLMIRAEDRPGALAEIIGVISEAEINVLAICAYSFGETAAFMLVTNDNNASRSLLEEDDFKVVEEEVVLLTLENKPGALQSITDFISEYDIDLKLMYGSVPEQDSQTRIVLIAENNLDLIMLLKNRFGRS